MRFDRRELKSCARESIAGTRPYFLAPGLVFVGLSYLISQLIYRLCGYYTYMMKYTAMVIDVMENGAAPYAPTWPSVAPAAWVLCAALFLMSMVLGVGMMWYCLRLSRRMESRIRNLFDVFGIFTKIMLLQLCKLLLIIPASLFFVIPGYVLYYRYSFAEFVLFDHPEYGVIRCMRESAKLTRGLKRELFVLDLSMIGWYILRYFIFVSVAFITPYEHAIKSEYYNRASGWTPELEGASRQEPPTPFI